MANWPSMEQYEQVKARVGAVEEQVVALGQVESRVDTAESKITALEEVRTGPVNLGLNDTNLIWVRADEAEEPAMTTGLSYFGFRWNGIGTSVRHVELHGASVENLTQADFSSDLYSEGQVTLRTRANGSGDAAFAVTPTVTPGVFNGVNTGIRGISLALPPFPSVDYEGFVRPYAGELRIYTNPNTAFPVRTQTQAAMSGITGIVSVNGVVTENRVIGEAMWLMTARPTEQKAFGILDGANMPIVPVPSALNAPENNLNAHRKEGFEIVWPASGTPYLHLWRIAWQPTWQGGQPTQHYYLPLTAGLPQ
ncbi:hypothetical protein D3875_02630 [Deinococcus cavernae]|uniref:Uncharacterized protein n=1 Tax=Deinococcus cavernae TaxID=2320857 RepID=A0A418VFN6_9DEIO|nr:hypothetical protein [Deinococcus cavernae]RJF74908.1 hypothetical protein D3875_02630 [Deinococcus cavernae]